MSGSDKTNGDKKGEERTRFGTFGGVFTPSILTILGVIMFMRASFVLGNAGLLAAVAILIIAKGITFTTALSLSAIGTNMQVRGGGAYFLISRVLGPEFGGAIGIALYFALALSVPFYILGFTEALLLSFPQLAPYALLISFATAGLLLVIAFVGADWAIKTQFFIMAILALAILAFMAGAAVRFSGATFMENLGPAYSENPSGGTYSFWLIFAIYFPAVTGIDAGVNMSGDLEDPAKSLPKGTLAAVGVGFLVYLVQAILSAGAFSRADMIAQPYAILKDNALFGAGFLVAAGVFAATLSSALGSCLGAPRVLQAVSRDDVLSFLRPFAKGTPVTDEPRRALAVTTAITAGILLWAGLSGGSGGAALNSVAAVITMFFLYTYGMTNLAAFIEAFGKNPSFRPRFRFFHWTAALLGGLGCVGAALLINAVAAVASLLLILGLLWYLKTRELEASFGDARRGFVYTNVRKNLLRLRDLPEDAKNWRPTILVLSGNPASRETLVSYAVWLEAGRGIVLLANVLRGTVYQAAQRRRMAEKQLVEFCRTKSIQAFPVVAIGEDVTQSLSLLLQTVSLGPIRPNLAMFGWASASKDFAKQANLMRIADGSHMSLVVLQDRGVPPVEKAGRIDVWWRGRQNGELMLLLSHLITRNWEWLRAEIRVLRLIDGEAGREPASEALQELIHAARVDATAVAVLAGEGESFADVCRRNSFDADLVVLGFALPEEGDEEAFHENFSAITEKLPTTLLVRSSGRESLV